MAVALTAPLCAHAVAGYAQAPVPPESPRTVWDGVFTDDQSARGRRFYSEHCAACHGGSLEGGEARALKGDRFWVSWQGTAVSRLLGHVSANMPHSEDGALKGTLGETVYVDIVAHILNVNQFPPGSRELTAAASAGIQIVRKDGAAELPSGSFAQVVGCLNRGADRTWRLVRGSAPRRIVGGETVDRAAPLGDREYTLMFVLTPLEKFLGHRMSVRATLMGDGGGEGLNVTTIESVSATCE